MSKQTNPSDSQPLSTSHDPIPVGADTSGAAGFDIPEDDPRHTSNRGGLAADAGNEGSAGMLPTDGGTVGLVAPDGTPGGPVPSPPGPRDDDA